ncbi:subtilisin-like protein, partial [Byssothecium circinans]
EDKVGHGTHCAGIILQVCPYADVHVYRVAQDDKGIDPKHVADALEDAIQENIDIVSMSFGWYDQDKHLQEVIEKAKDKGILMFAAHSNSGEWSDGGRFGRTFPARADEVIAIDSSDADGRPSSFNPSFESPMVRFIALGESVRSAYPINFPNDGDEEGYRRMSGNSVAAPVAAGIAGLILEFAR